MFDTLNINVKFINAEKLGCVSANHLDLLKIRFFSVKALVRVGENSRNIV